MSEVEFKYSEDKVELFVPGIDCARIEEAARGMAKAEVLNYYGYEADELSDHEKHFFNLHYRIGRATGQNLAVDNLFNQMKQKGGAQAAISYLIRFSDSWEEVKEADGDMKRKFTILIE